MTAMDEVAASVGLRRISHPENIDPSGPPPAFRFEDIPGWLGYVTVDTSSPVRLEAGWGATDRMVQPPDFSDTAPKDPPAPFFQVEKADIASWWPAASRRYRYILEIRASWTYFIVPWGDPTWPPATVRPT
ncbi:hypothetical protein [Actinoplanes sp. NPDC049681]|uniref:hypothetical protein n=1 Tax=Actinoplanes sp. NPDC049681 TaxID=3363905 RepID=UPI0037B0D9FC